jgi:hypothetical protein
MYEVYYKIGESAVHSPDLRFQVQGYKRIREGKLQPPVLFTLLSHVPLHSRLWIRCRVECSPDEGLVGVSVGHSMAYPGVIAVLYIDRTAGDSVIVGQVIHIAFTLYIHIYVYNHPWYPLCEGP